MINVQGLTCQAAELNYKKKFGIKIISPHRTYYLACEDENDQSNWIKEINDSSVRNSDYRLHVVDPDFSEDCTFHDIQRAVDFAKEGDHVVLRSGIYKVPETVVIKKPLTIRGVYPDSSLVHIASSDSSKSILRVDSFNENLTVQQLEKQRLLDGGGSVKFEHVTLTQNAARDSILFYESASCLEIVSGSCTLQHVHLRASYGVGVTVKNRLYIPPVKNTTDAAVSTTPSTASIESNTQPPPPPLPSTGSKKPICDPPKLIMTECHVEFNKLHGMRLEDDTLCEVTKSLFQKNDGNAILCKGEASMRIERSVFSGHTRNAIVLESTKTSTICGNKMQLNGPGGKSHIHIAEDAAPCALEENDFL